MMSNIIFQQKSYNKTSKQSTPVWNYFPLKYKNNCNRCKVELDVGANAFGKRSVGQWSFICDNCHLDDTPLGRPNVVSTPKTPEKPSTGPLDVHVVQNTDPTVPRVDSLANSSKTTPRTTSSHFSSSLPIYHFPLQSKSVCVDCWKLLQIDVTVEGQIQEATNERIIRCYPRCELEEEKRSGSSRSKAINKKEKLKLKQKNAVKS
jgi:hypothetical protein